MSPHRAPGPGSARLQDSDRKKLRPSAPTSQDSSLPTSLLEDIRAAAARARLWRNLEELVRMSPTAAAMRRSSSPGRFDEDLGSLGQESLSLAARSRCISACTLGLARLPRDRLRAVRARARPRRRGLPGVHSSTWWPGVQVVGCGYIKMSLRAPPVQCYLVKPVEGLSGLPPGLPVLAVPAQSLEQGQQPALVQAQHLGSGEAVEGEAGGSRRGIVARD